MEAGVYNIINTKKEGGGGSSKRRRKGRSKGKKEKNAFAGLYTLKKSIIIHF